MEETNTNILDPLIKKAEQFGKISWDLTKLKTVDKLSDISAHILSRLFVFVFAFFFLLTLNIAAALGLGLILGANYWGFLVVAGFYGLLALLFMALQNNIKTKIYNSLLTILLN